MKLLRNISFSLLAAVIVMLMVASIVSDHIYSWPVTTALWATLAITALAYIWLRRKGLALSTILLHLSLAVILVGAALTHFTAFHDTVKLAEGGGASSMMPFSVTLIESRIDYYPGTSAPMDYVSVVDIDGRRHEISMNNIATHRGYRFYQTALGPGYSVLSVNYDPLGIPVTYFGYALFFAATVAFFFSKHTHFRALLKSLGLIALVFSALSANAAEAPKTLQRPLAKSFGELYVYWGDRVTPLQTLAYDFCRKVYGSDSYNGLTPEQVLTGWLFYYDDWKNEPFIKVKGDKVSQRVGKSDKYLSLSDFYSRDGYKLENPGSEPELLATDEKINLISIVCTGAVMKILPYRECSQTRWLSWTDQIPADYPQEGAQAMEHIASDIAQGQYNAANSKLKALREWQESMNATPSPTIVKAERIYNQYCQSKLPAILAATIGLIAFLAYCYGWLKGWSRNIVFVIACLLLTYLTAVLALRWIIGGHLPMSNGHETMMAMAWITLLILIIFSRKATILLPAGLLISAMAMLVAMMGQGNQQVMKLIPVLSSPLLSIHVMVIMTSYSLFALMMLNSVAALIKHNDGTAVARLATLSQIMLYPALFLLGIGIFIGAVWANQSWGRYWGWDPKETWALITFLIYAVPLHTSSFTAFRKPRTIHIYMFTAFLAVLITYFGVNYLMPGLHSYATA